MNRFFKKVNDELAKQRAQRKEDTPYYMDSQQIKDYQSILHVQTRTLFNLMAAEIRQEPDPVVQEKIRSGMKASKRYLKDHHFDDMKALLLKEVESAYKRKHPRSTLHPRFHEDFTADWVRKSAEGETPVKWAFEVTTPMIYKCGLWEPRSRQFIPIASKDIPGATCSSYEGSLGVPLLEIETLPKEPTARDDTHSVSDRKSTVATMNSSVGLGSRCHCMCFSLYYCCRAPVVYTAVCDSEPNSHVRRKSYVFPAFNAGAASRSADVMRKCCEMSSYPNPRLPRTYWSRGKGSNCDNQRLGHGTTALLGSKQRKIQGLNFSNQRFSIICLTIRGAIASILVLSKRMTKPTLFPICRKFDRKVYRSPNRCISGLNMSSSLLSNIVGSVFTTSGSRDFDKFRDIAIGCLWHMCFSIRDKVDTFRDRPSKLKWLMARSFEGDFEAEEKAVLEQIKKVAKKKGLHLPDDFSPDIDIRWWPRGPVFKENEHDDCEIEIILESNDSTCGFFPNWKKNEEHAIKQRFTLFSFGLADADSAKDPSFTATEPSIERDTLKSFETYESRRGTSIV
ncbi:hypothetical protein HD553DRAFT_365033 [Filobasidium floriforme]|uniref:uncharacterized protein n=1 Tax=Filobasidium floriforme TaxID=5210 RepID=UPI001E8CAECF|nr:uncharacterized protein HD553DRAFT_365033 [Filobasidium floriforme]KAH8089118.1 hypothetical protein HD553DRAFT_365033 [Filobasidium floriforme]